MPAKNNRRKIRKQTHTKKHAYNFRLITILFCIVVLLFYFFQPGRIWDGKLKTAIVFPTEEGDIALVVFDPSHLEITKIIIPADTQVEAAQQKGTWRIKSVWKLSENEGLDGSLMPETITKYFKFPVNAWAITDPAWFTNPKLTDLARIAFSTYSSNLSLKDKINIFKFAYGVDNTKKSVFDLRDTSYLKQKVLTDDSPGFVKNGSIPQYLSIIFQEPEISESEVKVTIIDASQIPGFADEIGELVEALGAKISVINKVEDESKDCLIASKNSLYQDVFSHALYCSNISETTVGNSDIELYITRKYFNGY